MNDFDWKNDSLFRACQLVGDHLDLKFLRTEKNLKNSEESLEDLCMHSHIYFRRIRLSDNWWKSITFPFVCFFDDQEIPVAVIPLREGEYQVYHPEKDQPFILKAEDTNKFSSHGYMFYRQLKESQLSISRIWNFIIQRRSRDWLIFLFLVLCTTLANLCFPLFTAFLFDKVIYDKNETLLWEISLGAALISIATLAFNYGREVMILRLESLSDHDLEMAVWQKLIQLPIRFFRNHNLYDLFTFTTAISSIRKLLVSHTIEVVFNGVFSFIYLGVMFYYSLPLSFVALFILAIEMVGILISIYFGVGYGRELLEKQIRANNRMLEIVQSLTKVRLAGAEIRMFNRWDETFKEMTKSEFKLLLLHLKSNVFSLFWSNTSTWILYFIVILILSNQQTTDLFWGTLTLGSFMAFFSAFALFSHALFQLGNIFLNIVNIVPLWEKTKAFAEAQPEEKNFKPEPAFLKGGIYVENLTYRYEPHLPSVLNNISFRLSPGERIAFVGPSGSGKTTLLKLLLGFEGAYEGIIYYDDNDIKEVNLQALRRQLGVALQSGLLFDGTILDNINSGRQYRTDQVIKVLELIGANAFIGELPMGIQTIITNGGSSLSGGQRQLILLARALVGNPKILILDEATSSLDNNKQNIIYQHLDRLAITQVIVAQRLDTIEHVDRIYVMDKGSIVQEGTFLDLANKPGLFADLYRSNLKDPLILKNRMQDDLLNIEEKEVDQEKMMFRQAAIENYSNNIFFEHHFQSIAYKKWTIKGAFIFLIIGLFVCFFYTII